MSAPAAPAEQRYGDLPHQVLSLYEPSDASHRSNALVVAVHGGAWRAGGRGLMATTAEGLAARGHPVAAIAYRQRPVDPVADMLTDIEQAMAWARAQHAGRVVLLGDSAGAHAVALHTLRARGAAAPDLWVSLCGALSLDALRRPHDDEQRERFAEYRATLSGGGGDDARLDRDDPVRVRETRDSAPPPVLAATSAHDFFEASTLVYVRAALAYGDEITLHRLGDSHPECRHSWQLDATLTQTKRLFDLVAAWIAVG